MENNVINLLRFAVDVAGDGGNDPFTEEERILMYNFLNKIEKDYGMECK